MVPIPRTAILRDSKTARDRMMHSMRASSSSVTLKVDVRELAKLIAENNQGCGRTHEDDDETDSDWHHIESGNSNSPQITALDALMLVRVRGATEEDLRSVYQDFNTSDEARAILDRAADAKRPPAASTSHGHEEEGGEDPWCWQSLWRETTRLWQTASTGGPPPCCVQ